MLISIIIPTYNRASLLTECINNILEQTYKDFEIIIVSDGSTDHSKYEISKINDSRIQFIDLDKNYGYPAKARNEGINISKGEFIAFCDDDDLWEKDKLEKQMKMVHLGYNFIYSNFKFINKSKGFIRNLYSKDILNFILNKLNNKISYLFMAFTNPIVNSSVLVQKKIITSVMFDESKIYKATEDYQLWIKIYDSSKTFYLTEESVSYRIHENNISSDILSNLTKCVLVMKAIDPKNFIQIIFKKMGVIFYSLRISIYKLYV